MLWESWLVCQKTTLWERIAGIAVDAIMGLKDSMGCDIWDSTFQPSQHIFADVGNGGVTSLAHILVINGMAT
eukprot:10212360-Ditylum_brightwellii.AAC.1